MYDSPKFPGGMVGYLSSGVVLTTNYQVRALFSIFDLSTGSSREGVMVSGWCNRAWIGLTHLAGSRSRDEGNYYVRTG